jgi:cytochrome c553
MWNLSLDEIKNIADYYQTKESTEGQDSFIINNLASQDEPY